MARYTRTRDPMQSFSAMKAFRPDHRGPGFRRPRIPSISAVWILGVILGALPASSQTAPSVSLNDLALDWATGEYVSPIVCKMEAGPVRGLRRVRIERGPKSTVPHISRIIFKDIEADEALRCFTELGADAPNLLGSLDIRHSVTKRRDTVFRDFKSELRRNHGFEFDVIRGALAISKILEGEDETHRVDFKRGKARIHLARSASDFARLLADFSSPRKVVLELESRDGFVLKLPLALVDR